MRDRKDIRDWLLSSQMHFKATHLDHLWVCLNFMVFWQRGTFPCLNYFVYTNEKLYPMDGGRWGERIGEGGRNVIILQYPAPLHSPFISLPSKHTLEVWVDIYIIFFFLFLLNGFRIREEFKSAEEYWPLERKLCSALMNKEEVCLSLGSFLSKII